MSDAYKFSQNNGSYINKVYIQKCLQQVRMLTWSMKLVSCWFPVSTEYLAKDIFKQNKLN